MFPSHRHDARGAVVCPHASVTASTANHVGLLVFSVGIVASRMDRAFAGGRPTSRSCRTSHSRAARAAPIVAVARDTGRAPGGGRDAAGQHTHRDGAKADRVQVAARAASHGAGRGATLAGAAPTRPREDAVHALHTLPSASNPHRRSHGRRPHPSLQVGVGNASTTRSRRFAAHPVVQQIERARNSPISPTAASPVAATTRRCACGTSAAARAP